MHWRCEHVFLSKEKEMNSRKQNDKQKHVNQKKHQKLMPNPVMKLFAVWK